MATIESWKTRDEILSAFSILENCLENYKRTFERLDQINTTILNNPTKKADFVLLINQDPNITLAQIIEKYNKAKNIRNWIIANT